MWTLMLTNFVSHCVFIELKECKTSGTPRSCGFLRTQKDLVSRKSPQHERTFPHGYARFLTGSTSTRAKWRDWHATYISFPHLQTSFYQVTHTSARKVTLSFCLFPRRIIRF